MPRRLTPYGVKKTNGNIIIKLIDAKGGRSLSHGGRGGVVFFLPVRIFPILGIG